MKIRVEYRQNGYFEERDIEYDKTSKFPHSYVWNGSRQLPIKCCNTRCNGSYDLNWRLEKFAQSGKEYEEDWIICQGVEFGGTKFCRRCINSLHYRFSYPADTQCSESGEAD